MREEVIKEELLNRVNALKLLETEFAVDGISFEDPLINHIRVYGDFNALAKMFKAEVYDTIIANNECRAFEIDGIEIYSVR